MASNPLAMTKSILWFRQDLRLFDQPALAAAVAQGPVLAVYILDEETPGLRPMGGAARWWLHHSLSSLRQSLREKGGDLVLRRGRSASVLHALMAETGAETIHALHHYEPGWKGFPKVAGMFTRIQVGLREIRASTTMVAR